MKLYVLVKHTGMTYARKKLQLQVSPRRMEKSLGPRLKRCSNEIKDVFIIHHFTLRCIIRDSNFD